MAETAHLKLPVLEAGQAQKHVTVNEAVVRLDAIVQLAVLDSDRVTPPALPSEGDRHIVASGATGLWAGRDHRIALWQDGAWMFLTPEPGWTAFDAASASTRVWDGASWLDGVARLGIGGAVPDATSRLAVASDAVLFDHAGDSVQVKLNKAEPEDTGSLLFQTGHAGRAEIGLTGDDDLHVKVSADGLVYADAIVVHGASGEVSLGVDLAIAHGGTGASDAAGARSNLGAAASCLVERFTASGTWARPAGAKLVLVTATGAGGGGGGGSKAGAGAANSGGGGGGGGGRVTRRLVASALGAVETVTVGTGGPGGAGATVNGSGANGSAGGASSFGSHVIAYGGGAGSGGGVGIASGGGAGGSERAAGGDASGATGGSASDSVAGAGGSGLTGQQTIGLTQGAGGSGSPANGNVGVFGPLSMDAGGGGAGGGGVTAGNVATAGGVAVQADTVTLITAGAAGGGDGSAGSTRTDRAACGGAGGGGHATGHGGTGGIGGTPGGGGGGGGASHGGNGGAGGAGGRGEVVVVTFF